MVLVANPDNELKKFTCILATFHCLREGIVTSPHYDSRPQSSLPIEYFALSVVR